MWRIHDCEHRHTVHPETLHRRIRRSIKKISHNGPRTVSRAGRHVRLVKRKKYAEWCSLIAACCRQAALLFAVGSELSLPGRAELQKLGPPALPLAPLGLHATALVGAEALNVSCTMHIQS